MNLQVRLLIAPAIVAALALAPSNAAAQAFTPPQGFGSLTFGWQLVDNTGHRLSDGTFLPRGDSVTTSALVDLDYGITDRFSAGFGLPYVFAKNTGGRPTFSGLPIDECQCWQSSFADFSASARYRLGGDSWAVTPLVRYGQPTHNYPYEGEAVVGRNLKELQVGVSSGLRLARLPKASMGTGYTYAFTERPIEDLKIDRSSGYFEFGYAVAGPLFLRGVASFQHTHGGLRSSELFTGPREYFAQRDRVLKSHYWQLGGGGSYSAGPVDLFLSIAKYVWGRDAHNGWVYSSGATWYFDLLK